VIPGLRRGEVRGFRWEADHDFPSATDAKERLALPQCRVLLERRDGQERRARRQRDASPKAAHCLVPQVAEWQPVAP